MVVKEHGSGGRKSKATIALTSSPLFIYLMAVATPLPPLSTPSSTVLDNHRDAALSLLHSHSDLFISNTLDHPTNTSAATLLLPHQRFPPSSQKTKSHKNSDSSSARTIPFRDHHRFTQRHRRSVQPPAPCAPPSIPAAVTLCSSLAMAVLAALPQKLRELGFPIHSGHKAKTLKKNEELGL